MKSNSFFLLIPIAIHVVVLSTTTHAFFFKKANSLKSTPEVALNSQVTQNITQRLTPFQLTPLSLNRSHITNLSPSDSLFTIQDTLTLLGETEKIKEVLINTTLISLKNTRSFKYELQMTTANTYPIQLSFITNDNQFFQKTIYITKLHTPDDLSQFSDTQGQLVKVYNHLLKPEYGTISLSNDLTQQIFQSILNGNPPSWTPQYPDNQRHPNKKVTYLQFYTTLVKQLNLKQTSQNLSFDNLADTHWAVPYLSTAVNHKLLSSSESFSPYKAISIGDALSKLIQIPPFNTITPSHTLTISKKDIDTHQQQLYNTLKENQLTLENSKELTFKKLKRNQLYTTSNILIQGYISPHVPFQINNQTVTPSENGAFKYPYVLNTSSENIHITAFNQTKTYPIYYVQPYTDLKNHWIEKTALQLQYLGYLSPTQNFLPKSSVSLTQFSKISNRFFLSQNTVSSLQEMHQKTSSDNTLLLPSTILNKAVAISLIVPRITSTNITAKLPYWDVTSTLWARANIETAYSLGIIANSHKLMPLSPITKAELIAILSKIPKIKKEIEDTFYYD